MCHPNQIKERGRSALLGFKQSESSFEYIVQMNFDPISNGSEAGISIFQKDDNYINFTLIKEDNEMLLQSYVLKNDKLIIADYKATSKKGDVTIDAPWQISYKRQIEIYQWLFRQNGFDVDDMSYFVYCNGIKDSKVFDNCLNFEVKILPYKANDSWVTPALKEIKNCLNSDELPEESDRCDYCAYNRKIKLFG